MTLSPTTFVSSRYGRAGQKGHPTPLERGVGGADGDPRAQPDLRWDPIAAAHPEFLSYQRTHLFALVLTRVGALPQQAAADAVAFLLSAPDLVVHNPFTNQEGPLRLAVLDITRR